MAQVFINLTGKEGAVGSKEDPFVSIASAIEATKEKGKITFFVEDQQILESDLTNVSILSSETASLKIGKLGIILTNVNIDCDINVVLPSGPQNCDSVFITHGNVTFKKKVSVTDAAVPTASGPKITLWCNQGHLKVESDENVVKVNREFVFISNNNIVESKIPKLLECCGGSLLSSSAESKMNKLTGAATSGAVSIFKIIGYRTPGYIYGSTKTNLGFNLFNGSGYLFISDIKVTINGKVEGSLINFTASNNPASPVPTDPIDAAPKDSVKPNIPINNHTSPFGKMLDGKFVDNSLGFLYNTTIDGTAVLCNAPEKLKLINCNVTQKAKVSEKTKILADEYLISDNDATNFIIDASGKLGRSSVINVYLPKNVKMDTDTIYFKVVDKSGIIAQIHVDGLFDPFSNNLIRLTVGQSIELLRFNGVYYIKHKN